MQNSKALSIFLRSGIIILLLISLLVIVFPVNGPELFYIPVMFASIGIGIVVLYGIYETKCLRKNGDIYFLFKSGYRSIILWYIFYFIYLEVLAFIQYLYSPVRFLSLTLTTDLFLLLSIAPFVIALVYPWFSNQIGMARQTDRDYGSDILVNGAIFYRRHRLAFWLACLSLIILITLYLFYITGKSTPGTIGWMLSSYVILLLSPIVLQIFW
jgi:hypothetical protein